MKDQEAHFDIDEKSNHKSGRRSVFQSKTRLGESAILLSLLSACGGGGGSSTPSSGSSSGHVIDGYVSGARVFRDANGNNRFDLGEDFTTTNARGFYSNLKGSTATTIVVDDNEGNALDTVTGFPLSFTMSSPGDYSVITPLTTLVVGLQSSGLSRSESEAAIKQVFGLSSDIDLSRFDPFSGSPNVSQASVDQYKATAVKIANTLMASDNEFAANSLSSYANVLSNFAQLIKTKSLNNETLSLSDASVLRELLPGVSTNIINQLSSAHSYENYLEVLDGQLIFLSSNFDGTIKSQTQYGDELVYIEVAVELNETINSAHTYEVNLSNRTSGVEITSSDLVAAGSRVAIFRFKDSDVRSLGDGQLDVGLTNLTLGSEVSVRNEINLEVLAASDTPPVFGGGTGSSTTTTPVPENIVSDDGVVADGYISGAKVFRDENENEEWDAGEEFVTTNSSGEYSGLGGSADKPIVAIGVDGSVDTSTGAAFNSVLSAPAGSKIVNPITTIINEIMQDDTSLSLDDANSKVATAFGMEAVIDAGIDFTKFDPISKKTIAENGAQTAIADDNLADMTQGVATFVANLIVSGAAEKSREAGGDAAVLSNTTKSIISNLKDVVKAKSAPGAAKFDFANVNDIKLALGSDFKSSSPALTLAADSFSNLNPSNYRPNPTDGSAPKNSTAGILSQTALLEKQILGQTEFGDGVLTSSEASGGATLVLGPTVNPATGSVYEDKADVYSGAATAQITNSTTGKVFYKTATFKSSEYTSLDLTETFLTGSDGLLGGTINIVVKKGTASDDAEWASLTDRIFTDQVYFHHNALPEVTFDNSSLTPSAGIIIKSAATGKLSTVVSGSENNTDVDAVTLSGKVQIDIGTSVLPGSLKLFNLVSSVADGVTNAATASGRSVDLEFVDGNGDVKFAATATVNPNTGASKNANTGLNEFDWSISVTDALVTSAPGETTTFGQLADGNYKIVATFSDAYGAGTQTGVSDVNEYTKLTINRDAPEIDLDNFVVPKASTNVSDGQIEIALNLKEAAIGRTDAQNKKIIFTETIKTVNSDGSFSDVTQTFDLKDAISGDARAAGKASGTATASYNADNTVLNIVYTPVGKGTLDLAVQAGAFTDGNGNSNTTPLTNVAGGTPIAFDLTPPTISSITLKNSTINSNDTALDLVVEFSEPVTSFTKNQLSISKISNLTPLEYLTTYSSSADFVASNAGKTWTASVKPVADLQGSITVSVAGASYADPAGNPGSGGSADFTVDTKIPQIFSVKLDETTEKAEYGVSALEVGDTIDILVTFDKPLQALDGGATTPTIALQIGSETRSATLVDSGSIAGETTIKFSYQVTRSDLTSEDGIGLANSIAGGPLKGVNGNTAVLDLTTAPEPLDLTTKRVDGRSEGAAVDGYVEGAIIYADNNITDEGGLGLSDGDPIAQADATGGFSILGATGPLVLEGGFDISTNKDFNVRYSAPASYKVINPITTLVAENVTNFASPASISAAEQVVYNAIDKPLGDDVDAAIGTTFSITPDTPSADGTLTRSDGLAWNEGDVGKFIEGNNGSALLLDTSGTYRIITPFTDGSLISSGNWQLLDKKASLLSSYNAYEAIAEAADGDGNALSVKGVVDTALEYQQVAASVALVVDFISTASSGVRGETSSIPDLSTLAFEAISTNLDSFVDTINAGSPESFFPDGVPDKTKNAALKSPITSKLQAIFEPVGSADPISGWATVVSEFPEVYDLLATAIIGIKLTASKPLETYQVAINGTSTAAVDKQAVAEDGINALTEIVQIQSVIQSDILSQISKYYTKPNFSITPDGSILTPAAGNAWSETDVGKTIEGNGGKVTLTSVDGSYTATTPFTDNSEIAASSWTIYTSKPTDVTVDKLLGIGADGTQYSDVPVGTVVPIRYDLQAPSQATAYEGDANGSGAEFDFVISRAGSIKTTSSLEYEISGSVTSADISGGTLTGTLFFDVNEKQKTLTIRLNNDDLREPSETLTLSITDPTNTSQIVNETASVIVRDDDPSTPEIVFDRSEYVMSEGGTQYLDDVSLDYFDTSQSTYFKLDWDDGGGTLKTTHAGSDYTQGTWVDYFTMQTSLLRNLEFTAGTSVEGFANVTLTAAEYDSQSGLPTVGGRTANTEFNFTFDVHKTPALDGTDIAPSGAKDYSQLTGYAGVDLSIPGVRITDVDSEFVSVNVSSNISGVLSTTSTANFTTVRPSSQEISFSGTKAAVQSALDGLAFMATNKSDTGSGDTGAIFTFRVDDGDTLHVRNVTGVIDETVHSATKLVAPAVKILPSAPTIEQSFTPKITVMDLQNPTADQLIWGGLSGLRVGDLDTPNLKVVVKGDKDKIDFRIYDPADTIAPVKQTSSVVGSDNALILEGSASSINDQLNLLQVDLRVNEANLISVAVYDQETSIENPATNVVSLNPSYIPTDNIVPEPGGNISATGTVLEDGGAQPFTISGVRLFDEDAKDAQDLPIPPDTIRIVGVTGGTVSAGGTGVFDSLTGEPRDLTVAEFQNGLTFNPAPDFSGVASIDYVVVDPQQSTFTSSISKITLDVGAVNDKPEIQMSNQSITYVEGEQGQAIFPNASVADKDDAVFSEIRLTPSEATWSQTDDVLITPSAPTGVTKRVGNSELGESELEVIYTGNMTASEVSTLLANVRFETQSDNLTGTTRSSDQTREITLSVKDNNANGAETSAPVTRTITLRDVNDAPELSVQATPEDYFEADEGSAAVKLPLSTFISRITDPETDSIISAKISFVSGYKSGQDFLTVENLTDPSVAYQFDAATGTLSISTSGLSSAEFITLMGSVNYSNNAQNPKAGNDKKIKIEVSDEFGAKSTSDEITICVKNVNDIPKFVDAAGVALDVDTTQDAIIVFGGQYVEGSGAVRVVSDLNIRDVDNAYMLEANLKASDGQLNLTKAGQQLRDAYNLTVTTGSTMKVSGNDMTTDELQSILREVTLDSLNVPSSLGAEAVYADVTLSIRDASGVIAPESDTSATLKSKIKLLKAPSVQVKLISDTSGTEFSETADQTAGVTKVLTFNDTFSANQLLINLEQATIKTEDGRFTYDTEKNDYALREARHIDVSAISAEAGASVSTTITGQEDADVIIGSSFADTIDGNGGVDRILAGDGSDRVALRLTDGLYLDGGAGVDTLTLPRLFTGSIATSENGTPTILKAGQVSVTVVNFENIDAGSVESDVVLSGGQEANILRGGLGADTLQLGQGGDIVSGGAGADTFLVDVENLDLTGSRILDLSSADKIKFVDGSGAKVDFSWRHIPSYETAVGAQSTNEAWIEAGVNPSNPDITDYKLKFTYGGAEKAIDIGTELFGSKEKWVFADEDFFILQPEINTRPVFTNQGPTSSLRNPIELSEASGTYSITFADLIGGAPTVTDADNASGTLAQNDALYLTVSSDKFNVTSSATGLSFANGLFPQFEDADVNSQTLDEALADLKISDTGVGREVGNVTISVTDGYSQPLSKVFYFEVPNKAPTLSVSAISDFSVNDIGTQFNLSQTGVIPLTSADFISDDLQDISENALTLTISVDGADVTLAENIYSKYVEIIDGNITIAHDGISALEDNWVNVLKVAAENVTLTRDTVGTASVAFSVSDAAAASAATITREFNFNPLPLAQPTLVVEGAQDNLNGGQFNTGTVRASVQGKGAAVGDTLTLASYFDSGVSELPKNSGLTISSATGNGNLTLDQGYSLAESDVGKFIQAGSGLARIDTVGGAYTLVSEFESDAAISVGNWHLMTKKSVDILLSESATLPGQVEAAVQVALSEFIDAGAAPDGTYFILSELIPAAYPASKSPSQSGLSFVVDATAPTISEVAKVNGGAELITNSQAVNTITVAPAVSDGSDLTFSVVNLRTSAAGQWHELPKTTKLKLGNDGLFPGEVIPTGQVDNGDGTFTLSFAQPLAGGVYAVAVRDLVGNASSLDAAQFDIKSTTLPRGMFVIDDDLSEEDVTLYVDNAEPIPGGILKFKLNRDEAGSLKLQIGSEDAQAIRPTDLPADLIELRIEVFADEDDVSVLDAVPNISATFQKAYLSNGTWSLASGETETNATIDNTDTSIPIVDLNLQNAFAGITAEFIGIKITAKDIAGNVVEVVTGTNQIELDLTADKRDETEENAGLVTSRVTAEILNGISIGEAKDLAFTLTGLDVGDISIRTTHALTITEFAKKLVPIGEAAPVTDVTAFLETLKLDAVPVEVTSGGTKYKFPSFNSGTYYLDLETANTAEETFNISSIGVIQDVNLDLSSILPADGSPDTQLIIINELQDDSKNIDFRFDILPSNESLGSELLETLTLDVKPASILNGLTISDATDTGVKGDLVTSEERPEITFITDEEIRINTALELGDGLSNPRLVHLSTLSSDAPTLKYDLIVTESEELALEGGGTNYKYTAVLQDEASLVHGLWGVEVTDLAGNVTVSDATGVLSDTDPYFANSDLNSGANGIILIDQLGPPEPVVSIVGVEAEGGFLNSTEATSSVAVSIARAIDTSSADPVAENRVAKIDLVEFDGTQVNLASGQTEFTFDAATSDLSEGLHTFKVTTSDVAGNLTITDYTFVKDTIAPEPTKISIEGGEDDAINFYEFKDGLKINYVLSVAEDKVTEMILTGGDIDPLSPITLSPNENGEFSLDAVTLIPLGEDNSPDGDYRLTSTTVDPAGNIKVDEYDFLIDTTKPPEPTFTIEGAKGDLDYWETVNGVRIAINGSDTGDVIDASNLTINGTMMNATGMDSVYSLGREFLLNGENTLSVRVVDQYGTDAVYDYSFVAATAPDSVSNFSVVPSLNKPGENEILTLDVYLTQKAIGEFVPSGESAVSVDMFVTLPGEFDEISVSQVRVSSDVDQYELNTGLTKSGVFIASYSDDGFSNLDIPFLSFDVRLPGLRSDYDGLGASGTVLNATIVSINENNVADFNYAIDLSDIITTDNTI